MIRLRAGLAGLGAAGILGAALWQPSFARAALLTVHRILAVDPQSPSPKSGGLREVISDLNQAAAKFQSAEAEFTWDQYQSVVQEHDIQTGKIDFERSHGITLMAANIQQMNGQPAPRIVVYNGSELRYYEPTLRQLQIFRAGANRETYESFLTLGFGGSGADLQTNWTVAFEGMETIGGVRVAKLDLQPKSPGIRSMFTHVAIWVDPARAVSLKQVFYAPSGDVRTSTFEVVKYNEPLRSDIFRIVPPKGTTVQSR
jgi:outer membrane lipoprotein-sorting protein